MICLNVENSETNLLEFHRKGLTWEDFIRPEATGYGTVYFAQKMLQTKSDDIKGNRIISGSGNVAQFAAEKIISLEVMSLHCLILQICC